MTRLLYQMRGYQGCEETFLQRWSHNLLQLASVAVCGRSSSMQELQSANPLLLPPFPHLPTQINQRHFWSIPQKP